MHPEIALGAEKRDSRPCDGAGADRAGEGGGGGGGAWVWMDTTPDEEDPSGSSV